MKPILLLISTIGLLLATASAGETKRLAANDALPDVTLRTVDDASVKLSETVRGKPSVLIFYRGGWCPYCSKHLFALSEIQDDLIRLGVQMLAISPDRPEKLREKPEYARIPYLLLSDRTMEAAKAFGISFEVDAATREKYRGFGINLAAASGESHHLLPHPAVYVVDAKGVIRFAHVNEDYKVRLEPEKVLAAVKEVLK